MKKQEISKARLYLHFTENIYRQLSCKFCRQKSPNTQRQMRERQNPLKSVTAPLRKRFKCDQIYRVLSALTSHHISNSHRNPITPQNGPRKNETGHLSAIYFSFKSTIKQTNKTHPESMHLPSLDAHTQENNLPSLCTMSEAPTLQDFISLSITNTLYFSEQQKCDLKREFSIKPLNIGTQISHRKCMAHFLRKRNVLLQIVNRNYLNALHSQIQLLFLFFHKQCYLKG